jgi:hypothetical protein
MEIDNGAVLAGLHILMRKALGACEDVWKYHGRPEGVTITCGINGVHSASSWHYYGLAIDCRTHYFDEFVKAEVVADLKKKLPEYDIIAHSTHIHIEPSNQLAAKHGLMP